MTDPGPVRAASPAVVTWKDYADTTTAAVHGDLAALARHNDASAADLRRAHEALVHNTERMIEELKDYVNRVFSEHGRAVALTTAQTAAQVLELTSTRAGLEYVNAVFSEHRRAIDGTLTANAKAIDIALVQVEKGIQGREQAVSQRFVDTQRAVETALVQVGVSQTAQQRAVEVALVQVEQRIEAVGSLSAERVDGVRREAVAALAASEKAIGKSETTYEKRFEAVNEFRAQLADQTNTFMPREVAEALISESRRAAESAWTEVRSQVTQLQQRLDQTAGASAGSTKTIGYMVTAVGILLTIIIFAANYFTTT